MASLAKAALPDNRVSDFPAARSLPADFRAELFKLIKTRSFRTGHFILSSGETSRIYFNMKQTMMYPRGAELCARALLHAVRGLGADYVSGLEMGAVPVIGSMAAAISSFEGAPLATTFVRKQAKSHGTKDVIEGLGPDESLRDRYVVVIDDVSTTGKSILQAIEGVRAAGGIVEHAACIVDRAEGGAKLLASHGVSLHTVFEVDEFLA